MNALATNIISLFQNADFISEIYSHIQRAAILANDALKMIYDDPKNDTTVHLLPFEEVGTRTTLRPTSINTTDIKIDYDAKDMILVGGAALKIYDLQFSRLSRRANTASLENFINKTTSDIDIVWWPRIYKSPDHVASNNLVVITSPIIQTFAKIFVTKLNTIFQYSEVQSGIKNVMRVVGNIEFNATSVTFLPAGVQTISIHIRDATVFKDWYKLCDISIHDEINSQKNTMFGEKINTIQRMKIDPMYSLNPTHIKHKYTIIHLPGIHEFFMQQLLALRNLLNYEDPIIRKKSIVNYKRIEFLLNIINTNKSSTNVNILDSLSLSRYSAYNIDINNYFISLILNALYPVCETLYKTHKHDETITYICNDLAKYKDKDLTIQTIEIKAPNLNKKNRRTQKNRARKHLQFTKKIKSN